MFDFVIELYFLIAKFLANGHCQKSAKVLNEIYKFIWVDESGCVKCFLCVVGVD